MASTSIEDVEVGDADLGDAEVEDDRGAGVRGIRRFFFGASSLTSAVADGASTRGRSAVVSSIFRFRESADCISPGAVAVVASFEASALVEVTCTDSASFEVADGRFGLSVELGAGTSFLAGDSTASVSVEDVTTESLAVF